MFEFLNKSHQSAHKLVQKILIQFFKLNPLFRWFGQTLAGLAWPFATREAIQTGRSTACPRAVCALYKTGMRTLYKKYLNLVSLKNQTSPNLNLYPSEFFRPFFLNFLILNTNSFVGPNILFFHIELMWFIFSWNSMKEFQPRVEDSSHPKRIRTLRSSSNMKNNSSFWEYFYGYRRSCSASGSIEQLNLVTDSYGSWQQHFA